MKYLFLSIVTLLSIAAVAQKKPVAPPVHTGASIARPAMSRNDLLRIKRIEDTLRGLANVMLYDSTVRVEDTTQDFTGAIIRNMAAGKKDSVEYLLKNVMFDTLKLQRRRAACYQFIPRLVAALRMDNSFYYAFDSLPSVSRIYPPDSSFRIITWQLHYPRGRFRYYGVIQMRSQHAKIYPLRDLRDTLHFHTQNVLTPDNWYGQLYYRIIEKKVAKKTYYTLFGFEAASFLSRRKIIDVLTFDDHGAPRFGAPMFCFKYDSTHTKLRDTLSRFFIEYKWSAAPTLNYDNNMEMIVFDHLAPPDPRAKDVYFTYIPDGTYEGFKWQDSHWEWVEKVFNFAINEDDNPPIPAPLFGAPKKQPTLPDKLEK